MKRRRLQNGMYLMVDDQDAHWLKQHHWYANKQGTAWYAIANNRGGRPKTLRLHRLIMNAPLGLVVDHISGNALDNRRCNLRLATKSQNAANGNRHRDNATSRYKGVHFTPNLRKPWQGIVCLNGVHYRSPRFGSAIAAARAYDELALRLHGEFARCNFKSADA